MRKTLKVGIIVKNEGKKIIFFESVFLKMAKLIHIINIV